MLLKNPYWLVFLIILFIGNVYSTVYNFKNGKSAFFGLFVTIGLGVSIVLCVLSLAGVICTV